VAIIECTKTELVLLKEYIRTTSLVLLRYKCQAILMQSKGMSLVDIGDIVSRNDETVGRWIADFRKRRMASIFTGHQGNSNAGKLTAEQLKEIRETLQKPPSEQSIPKTFWDVPTLKKYLEATFGVIYESDTSYHFLLKFSNLSFKYPDTFDYRRDDKKVEKRIEEIRREIKPFLNDTAWEVFAADEVRIELEALTRRAWLKQGERTIVKVDRTRESQSYLGFLNQKSGVCHLYDMTWQNQEEVLKVYGRFLTEHPSKKICVVWDNAAFHKGKQIREALKKDGLLERVHLVALPPYAPDKNPIEHVWNDAKRAIANIQHDIFAETKAAFSNNIKSRVF
jgi:transposase